MTEGKGHCKHGEFDLKTGCPQCIAERRMAKAGEKLGSGDAVVVGEEGLAAKAEHSEPAPETAYHCPPDCRFSIPSGGSADNPDIGGCAVEDKIPVGARYENNPLLPLCPEYRWFTPAAKPAAEGKVGLALGGVAAAVGTAVINIDPGKAPSFAKHLEAAKHIVEIAASRQILTEADAKAANDDLNVMSELGKAVELERKSFTIPLNEHLAAINGAYKLITGPLQEADQITRRLLTAYKVEQQRKADEAEKLNQDAIDLARRQAEANNGEFTVDTKPVPVPFAPKLTRTDQGKSGLVDNWKFRIVDLEKLPREYMVPDEAMLNSIAKKQHDKKQVPGVEFYNEPSLRVTR